MFPSNRTHGRIRASGTFRGGRSQTGVAGQAFLGRASPGRRSRAGPSPRRRSRRRAFGRGVAGQASGRGRRRAGDAGGAPSGAASPGRRSPGRALLGRRPPMSLRVKSWSEHQPSGPTQIGPADRAQTAPHPCGGQYTWFSFRAGPRVLGVPPGGSKPSCMARPTGPTQVRPADRAETEPDLPAVDIDPDSTRPAGSQPNAGGTRRAAAGSVAPLTPGWCPPPSPSVIVRRSSPCATRARRPVGTVIKPAGADLSA